MPPVLDPWQQAKQLTGLGAAARAAAALDWPTPAARHAAAPAGCGYARHAGTAAAVHAAAA